MDAAANAWLRDQRAPFLFPLSATPTRSRAPANLTLSQRRAHIAERWRAYYANEHNTSFMLHGNAGNLEAQRQRLREKVSEAGLLLFFARQATSRPVARDSEPAIAQKHRCGKCEDCLAGDCGTCACCLDKVKFGGRGLRKQGCKMRRCAYPKGR